MATAPDLNLISPAIDALPAFTTAFIQTLISPSPRVVARPVFDVPAIVLTPVSVTTGSPAILAPTLNVRLLTAPGFIEMSPSLDALPAFAIPLSFPLSLAAGSPTLGASTFVQTNILVAIALTDSSPSLSILLLRQRHALAGSSVLVGSPVIQISDVSRTLTASSFINSSPVVSGAALGKVLSALSFAVAPVVIDKGILNSGIVIPADLFLSNHVLDFGLNALHNECDAIYVCFAESEDYADVLARAVGVKRFPQQGQAFGIPTMGSPGRMVVSSIITDGQITSNGTLLRWAAVDSTSLRLLAEGKLSSSLVVSSDSKIFTLSPIAIRLSPYIT